VLTHSGRDTDAMSVAAAREAHMMRRDRRLTYRVELPGGQSRLRELILYVAHQCKSARRFGKIKLYKIIWKADFEAFAERQVPITGRPYQRLRFGPAPVEMAPLLEEMQQDGLLRFESVDLGEGYIELRPVALVAPSMKYFSPDDIEFVDRVIKYYWNKTGKETSDESHGVAWRTRSDYDAIPYEMAFLSDERLSGEAAKKVLSLAAQKGWNSQ
jgi:Protein of unknown function (DUF4065)